MVIQVLYRIAALAIRLFPPLRAPINRFAIGRIAKASRNRPHPWSTLDGHVSWRGLTDRSYSARHLPPAIIPDLPPSDRVAQLFAVPDGRAQRLCPKSTCLFPAFAQYLTDGFIRTKMSNELGQEPDVADRKRNTSNHEIDLCPLYGLNLAQEEVLRTMSNAHGEKGKLKSEMRGGEEYPLRLFEADGTAYNPLFADAEGKPLLDTPLGINITSPEMRTTLFAVGGDRANATPQVAMINTLFLREHNRLADVIAGEMSMWDDGRVFDAARACVTVMFIKIVVEEYINHINSTPLKLTADPSVAWTADWNRPNWITAEFSLLYRWHSLIPEQIVWNGTTHSSAALRLDNTVLIKGGLANAYCDMSANNATELGLHNTAGFLTHVEELAINQARENAIAPFTAYQAAFSQTPAKGWADVTPDKALQSELAALYGEVEALEFYTGLFAQPRTKDGPLPPLLQSMVAVDAFSQALTNPLLSQHIWGDPKVARQTFTAEGLAAIRTTSTLRDVLARNTPGMDDRFVGMTREDWRPFQE